MKFQVSTNHQNLHLNLKASEKFSHRKPFQTLHQAENETSKKNIQNYNHKKCALIKNNQAIYEN